MLGRTEKMHGSRNKRFGGVKKEDIGVVMQKRR